MDKQNFRKTVAAMQMLGEALNRLKQAVEVKKFAVNRQRVAYKQNMTEKNAQLDALKRAVVAAATKAEELSDKIDEVLKEDGASNNHD